MAGIIAVDDHPITCIAHVWGGYFSGGSLANLVDRNYPAVVRLCRISCLCVIVFHLRSLNSREIGFLAARCTSEDVVVCDRCMDCVCFIIREFDHASIAM